MQHLLSQALEHEFPAAPHFGVEIKSGALKKVYTEDLEGTPEAELQKRIDAFHQAKIHDILEGLRARKA